MELLKQYGPVPFDSTKTDTIPATNPQAAYPNGCGGIDSYESYRQIFNGEVSASNNRELIFFRQNYGSEDFWFLQFP